MNRCNEVWAMGAMKYKETLSKEENGLFSSSLPPNDDLVIDLTIPTPPQSPAPEYQLVFIKLYFCAIQNNYNNNNFF